MKILWGLCLFVSVAVTTAGQTSNGLILSCTNPSAKPGQEDKLVRARSSQENEHLRGAPHGAKRTGKHELEVAWFGGKRLFTDEPPFDEPLDGVSWAYCGFNAKVNLHLILKQDAGLFTGVLLDDKTGALLAAGQKGHFSPDYRYYLAYEQPDGQDGETVKLLERKGAVLWN